MRSAVLQSCAAGIVFALVWLANQTPACAGVTLTNAAQIRALSANQAAASIPIHLVGVMICSAEPLPAANGGRDRTHLALVLSDPTASIYIAGTTNILAGYSEGDQLDVEGLTDPGQFAPYVRATAVHKVGTAPIPSPIPATYQTLVTGALDAQWVEVTGIVRSSDTITSDKLFGSWVLVFAVNGNKLTAFGTGPRPASIKPDAEVSIHCICFYQFNQQRQALNPVLVMPQTDPVKIIHAAPRNPFSSSIRDLATMFQFGVDNGFGHRIHLRGTVTYQQSPQMLWIRDDSGAAGIQSLRAPKLKVGDLVDVLGFTRYGSTGTAPGSVALEDAVIRRDAPGPQPAPVSLTKPSEAFKHNTDLVSLEATLLKAQPILGGEVLNFEFQGKAFDAVLNTEEPATLAHVFRVGSQVQITGICSVTSDDSGFVVSGIWHPSSFQILLRSAGDLRVIKSPPWWTPAHIILVLGLTVTGLAVVGGFLALQGRHRLKEQERQRAMAEREFAAILTERNRVAREIHDTLAQGLAATSVQLRLAKKQMNGASEAITHHLDLALQLVRGSLEEARNSIWNMRSQILENDDLAGALKEVLNQMADGSTVQTSFSTTGRPRRFAPVIESNLLRVGQEAIANAVNHARPTHIQVNLHFGDKHLLLEIIDNGIGFNPDNPPPSTGGFGLVGLRERAASLNGQLSIESSPGRGTSVKFLLPVSSE